VLPAHSAVMSRASFNLVEGKVVKERTGHRPHMLRPRLDIASASAPTVAELMGLTMSTEYN